MPTTRRSTRTDRHPCDQLSRPAARVHADGTAVPFPGPAGRGASPGEAPPTMVPRDASCTDGCTTDTPRDDDTPAAGAESAKPQVGGCRRSPGGFERDPVATQVSTTGQVGHGRHDAGLESESRWRFMSEGRPDHWASRSSPPGGCNTALRVDPLWATPAERCRARRDSASSHGQCQRFTGRTTVSSRVPGHPHLVPLIARDVHKRPADSVGRHLASPPAPPSREA
jgi:hypothetical protein